MNIESRITGYKAQIKYQYNTPFTVGTEVVIMSYDKDAKTCVVMGNVQGLHVVETVDFELLMVPELEVVKPKKKRKVKSKTIEDV